MAERKTKQERKRATAGADEADQGEADGQAADPRSKAQRRQARAGRKDRAAGGGGGGRAADQNEVEARLARIEEAVASQAERSEELISKLDEVLHEARKSARHAKSAVEQSAE
jgi:hypothetical protein